MYTEFEMENEFHTQNIENIDHADETSGRDDDSFLHTLEMPNNEVNQGLSYIQKILIQ